MAFIEIISSRLVSTRPHIEQMNITFSERKNIQTAISIRYRFITGALEIERERAREGVGRTVYWECVVLCRHKNSISKQKIAFGSCSKIQSVIKYNWLDVRMLPPPPLTNRPLQNVYKKEKHVSWKYGYFDWIFTSFIKLFALCFIWCVSPNSPWHFVILKLMMA